MLARQACGYDAWLDSNETLTLHTWSACVAGRSTLCHVLYACAWHRDAEQDTYLAVEAWQVCGYDAWLDSDEMLCHVLYVCAWR